MITFSSLRLSLFPSYHNFALKCWHSEGHTETFERLRFKILLTENFFDLLPSIHFHFMPLKALTDYEFIMCMSAYNPNGPLNENFLESSFSLSLQNFTQNSFPMSTEKLM